MRASVVFLVTLLTVLASLALLPAITATAPSATASPHLSPTPTRSSALVPKAAVSAPSPKSPIGGFACNSPTNSANYYNDFTVTFAPYNTEFSTVMSASNSYAIQNVSPYARAISVTVTPTNPADTLVGVVLTVWGEWWMNQSGIPIPPNAPGTWNLPIANGSAMGLLNDQKYFPPGSVVWFNLTISASLMGGPVYSPCLTPTTRPWWTNDAPSWEYLVDGGWPSRTTASPPPAFSGWGSDINLKAFPNIFNNTDPGPFQPLTLTMNSVAGNAIGGANIYYNVTYYDPVTNYANTTSGGLRFYPENASQTSVSVGPYYSVNNVTTINFYILAWEDWSGGAVNYIRSPSMQYIVSNGGTWCNATQPFAHYLTLTTGPPYDPFVNITTQTNVAVPAMSFVNVSIESVNPNTAIAYSYLTFNETRAGQAGISNGTVLLNALNATTQYTGDGTQSNDLANMGPYPPGVTISFHVDAADGLHCVIKSPTYTFHTAQGATPIVEGKTYFYVQAFDQAKGTYAAGATVVFSNATWIDHTQTNLAGFAYPNQTSSDVPAFLTLDQYYEVMVNYSGQSQSLHYFLSLTSNKTLTFFFDLTTAQQIVYAGPVDTITWGLFLGLATASVAVIPVYSLWRGIRRKAEEEEKRITL